MKIDLIDMVTERWVRLMITNDFSFDLITHALTLMNVPFQ